VQHVLNPEGNIWIVHTRLIKISSCLFPILRVIFTYKIPLKNIITEITVTFLFTFLYFLFRFCFEGTSLYHCYPPCCLLLLFILLILLRILPNFQILPLSIITWYMVVSKVLTIVKNILPRTITWITVEAIQNANLAVNQWIEMWWWQTDVWYLQISTCCSRLLLNPYDHWEIKVVTWKESVLNQVFCEDGKQPSVPWRMENFFSIRATKLVMKDCAVWSSLCHYLPQQEIWTCTVVWNHFSLQPPLSLFHTFILTTVSTRHWIKICI
jgi:hypothetical protein